MRLILTGIALLALLTACDDSDTDAKSDTEQDSGPSQPAADDDDETTDEPEKGDDAGGSTTTPPPPPPPPEPISCGDVDCAAPPFGVPCCTTAADVEARAALTEGACGVDLSPVFGGPSACVEFDQPGEPDESCPALEVPDADPVPGCCTSYGFCGTADNFIGIGCVTAPSEFGEPVACGDGGGDAGGGSSVTDGGNGGMSGPDAGDMSDAGGGSEPAPDASTLDAGANDASR